MLCRWVSIDSCAPRANEVTKIRDPHQYRVNPQGPRCNYLGRPQAALRERRQLCEGRAQTGRNGHSRIQHGLFHPTHFIESVGRWGMSYKWAIAPRLPVGPSGSRNRAAVPSLMCETSYLTIHPPSFHRPSSRRLQGGPTLSHHNWGA